MSKFKPGDLLINDLRPDGRPKFRESSLTLPCLHIDSVLGLRDGGYQYGYHWLEDSLAAVRASESVESHCKLATLADLAALRLTGRIDSKTFHRIVGRYAL